MVLFFSLYQMELLFLVMGKTYRYDPDELTFKPERHVVKFQRGYGKRKFSYRREILDRAEKRRQKEIEKNLLDKEFEYE